MEKAIKKAIEGGYETIWPTALKGYYGSFVLLDPLFWQALGKAEGWDRCNEEWCEGQCIKNGHLRHWLNFIRHLNEGKDADSFFEELIN